MKGSKRRVPRVGTSLDEEIDIKEEITTLGLRTVICETVRFVRVYV